jgi:very-short-patch-repair endonuclease
MKEWLNEVGIDFIEQHRINLNGRSYTKVDFFIPRMKICLYCDGDYWHSKLEVRERDVRIDRELEALGYIVFRTSQSEILNGMRPHWILEQYEHVALAVVC